MGDRHSLARLSDYRQLAGNADGAERTGGVLVTRTAESSPRSAFVHNCYLRAVRVCELELDRDSDRRDRSARAEQERGPGAARGARHVGGNHGEPAVSFHSGQAMVKPPGRLVM